MTIQQSGMRVLRSAAVLLCLVLLASGNLSAAGTECPAFDEFGDVACEDLSARLDNFMVTLNNQPDARATIIVYEGSYKGGRNPRRGEARAYGARMKDYLVGSRGLSADRITIVEGGPRKEFTVQLYICPRDAAPTATPIVGGKALKYRKGKISKREYKWTCLE